MDILYLIGPPTFDPTLPRGSQGGVSGRIDLTYLTCQSQVSRLKSIYQHLLYSHSFVQNGWRHHFVIVSNAKEQEEPDLTCPVPLAPPLRRLRRRAESHMGRDCCHRLVTPHLCTFDIIVSFASSCVYQMARPLRSDRLLRIRSWNTNRATIGCRMGRKITWTVRTIYRLDRLEDQDDRDI